MKKNIYLNVFLFIGLTISLASCVNQKQVAYFQKGLNGSDTINLAQTYIPKIQPGDILSISVSSLNPAASSFFNPYSAIPANTPDNSISQGLVAPLTQTTPLGYLVDPKGFITIPLLGDVKAQGYTTTDLRDTIKNKLKSFLKEPTVNIRFLNFKISVMGEVARPSVYVIANEKVTIPEALSMAGDMTIFGKRDNVLVIRDNNGKKEFGRINLNTRDVYTSDFYYLHSNDIIYVEPSKGRIAQTDKTYQILPIILSALSFLSIIFVYSRR
ncbi:polysaccharide biosynthesis/export family protein [Mucilaginibacter phyllosphaerae]